LARVRTYLDHNATTPLRHEARAAMLTAFDLCGSASSIHGEGRAARQLVEVARADVARLVGAEPKNVIFVSGASEANALALNLDWQRGRESKPLGYGLVSAIEHASVSAGGAIPGDRLSTLPVTADGRLDLIAAAELIEGHGLAPLVSLMLANNETGIVQPIAELAAVVKAAGGLLHCDAAQAVGKMPVDLRETGAGLMTLSSHKLGGPGGIGALILACDALHLPNPPIRGGGQEKGRRAGTENVAGIAGFGAAARAVRAQLGERRSHMAMLRARLEAGLRAIAPEVVIFGERVERLANTTCFAVPGIAAETALIAVDLDGFALSSGSACSSGKVRSSAVLAAMAVPPELAAGALRLSTGPETTVDEIDSFLATWKRLRERLHGTKRDRAA
jgi:cysteine desulfurase